MEAAPEVEFPHAAVKNRRYGEHLAGLLRLTG
jgi:hypothetical protein